jgi:hypothetical protein
MVEKAVVDNTNSNNNNQKPEEHSLVDLGWYSFN